MAWTERIFKAIGLLTISLFLFTYGCGSSNNSTPSNNFPDYGLQPGDVININIRTGENGDNASTQDGDSQSGQVQNGTGTNSSSTSSPSPSSQTDLAYQNVNNKAITMDEGTTLQLSSTGVGMAGQTYTNIAVDWQSDNPSVATVDTTGKVTAISPGTATITATYTDSTGYSISDSIVVEVLPSPLEDRAWKRSTFPLPHALWDHASTIYNGYIYTSGGHASCDLSYNCGFTKKVYYAPINPDGSVGKFQETIPVPVALRGHAMVAFNGYMYIIGGIIQPQFFNPPFPDPANFETILNEKVYYAKINQDGTLSQWLETLPLPPPSDTVPRDKAGLFALSAVAFKGHIYVSGGWNDALKKNVNILLTGQIDTDTGKIISWVHNSKSDLPYDLSKHVMAAATVNGKDYLYIIGGNSGSIGSQVFHREIYYAPIWNDGIPGQWQLASASLPVALIDHGATAVGEYLFVLGGRDRDDSWGPYNVYTRAYVFHILDNGDLEMINRLPDLPVPVFHHGVVAELSNDILHVYVIGGAGGDTEDPANRYDTVFYLE